MAEHQSNPDEADRDLAAFVQDVTTTLSDGKRHQTPGFGTLTTCTRKATAERPACKMAMFRASSQLRDFANGGHPPPVAGPHADVVHRLIEAMLDDDGVDVPELGRLAAVPVPGKKPKLIFHGADALNAALQ